MAEMNQKAQNVIDHTIRKEEECKSRLLSDILRVVNGVCSQSGLQYFAIGKLLTMAASGDISHPGEYQYDIAMLRGDYDRLIRKLAGDKGHPEVALRTQYQSTGLLRRLTAYISARGSFEFENNAVDIEVRLYIHPFDLLPSDPVKREQFTKAVAEKAAACRRLSLHYRSLRKDAGSLRANPLKILGMFKDKVGIGKDLQRMRKEYHMLLSTYSDMKEPEYAGRIDFLQYPAFSCRDIFPVSEKMAGSIPVMVPADLEKFSILPKEQEKERILKGRLLALQVFDRLCHEHSLPYVAMGDLASACARSKEGIPDKLEEKTWMLGMMREDYEQILSLLRDPDSDVTLIRTTARHPYVRSQKTGFCLKGYESSLPQQGDGTVYVLPFDSLPPDYEKKLSFTNKIKTAAANLKQQIAYEKGQGYKNAGRDDSWTHYEKLNQLAKTFDRSGELTEQIFVMMDDQVISMPSNEIFPPRRGDIMGQTIFCPCNPFFWHEEEDQLYTDYLAARREEVMKVIDDMSREYKIDYFAMSNLLIGAVIYHDVMPLSGQRNMDIGLLRTDYEAFIRLLREKGHEYGVSLRESLDGNGAYPLDVKYVTKEGCRYSQARVRLLPFDKVPEDFYLYQGFRDEIDPRNEDYKQILRLYDTEQKTPVRLPGSLSKEKKQWMKQADPAAEAQSVEKLAQSFNDDDRLDSYMWITFGKSRVITGKALFPLQRVQFRGMEINCPRDTSVWQPVLDAELERQVSCIQRADLILLEEFDKVCRKLNIGYFVCGGTMLGYMRHEGFIPWDDDVDVAMLRADYDRFINEAGPHLPEKFFLQTRQTDPHIPYLFSKIRLDDTEYITDYNEKRDFHKGICLDIFPFDFLPDDKEERERFVKEVRDLADQHHFIANRQRPIPEEECVPRNEQEKRYLNQQKLILKEYWKQDLTLTQRAYISAATRYNSHARERGLRTVGSFVPTYTYIDLNDLLPYQRGKFENIEVSVPKRPDIFLKMQYGDYMQLPPKHMQVAHRLKRWATWEDSGQESVAGTDPGER